MNIFCFKCKKVNHFEERKISFREICNYCGFDLHICKNCKYYQIGKPNDCLIPNIDPVLDKEKNNYCEEFSPIQSGSDIVKPSKNKFNSLFKDE